MTSTSVASSPDATLTITLGTSERTAGKSKQIPAMPVISKKQSGSVSESLGEPYSGEDKKNSSECSHLVGDESMTTSSSSQKSSPLTGSVSYTHLTLPTIYSV